MFNIALQASIFDLLSSSLSAQVYDDPPKTPAYPYVVVGDDSAAPFDTDTSVGGDIIATVHVWDNYDGKKRIKQLMDDIYNAMNRVNFPVAGYNKLDCMFDSSDVFFDKDGKTRHGVISFRILLDEGS